MIVTILNYYSSIITIIVKNDNILCVNYTIKTEKFLVVAFIVGTIFFACCTAMSLREKEDMFVICIFGIFFFSRHKRNSQYGNVETGSERR